MKSKIIALFVLLLSLKNLYAQKVDSTALSILQKSFDKVAELKNINYQMIFKDTWIKGSGVSQHQVDTAYANQLGKENILFYFNNKAANYITKDTLYQYQEYPNKSVKAFSEWGHQENKYSIYNVLGSNRTFISSETASISFNKAKWADEIYVIDKIYKTGKSDNGTKTTISKYIRIFIDKVTLLPIKSLYFIQTENDVHEQNIDIYDREISFPKDNPALNFQMDVFKKMSLRKVKPFIAAEENYPFLGKIAQNFVATNLKTNKKESLANYKGKVVLLDFWYLSCSPCRELMPALQRLSQKYEKSNFAVLGINIFDKNQSEIQNYLNDKGFRYKQLYNASHVKEIYGLKAFPTTILIDKKGKIINTHIGYDDDFEKKISTLIDNELKK